MTVRTWFGRSELMVFVVTALATWGVTGFGLRGPDYPAQLYRVELFHQAGYTIWDSGWYSGHYTLGYSLLFPPLAATLGITAVAVSATLASVVLFAVLARGLRQPGALPALCWFAGAMLINLAVGRLTFALGVAFGLGALLGLQKDHRVVAIGLTAMASMASPVAGFFLGMVLVALAGSTLVETHGVSWPSTIRTHLTMAVAAAVPVLIPALLFPSAGVFPLPVLPALGVVATGIGVAMVVPARLRHARIAAVLTAMTSVALFVVANPIGGNLIRLPTIFAWPVLAGALWNQRRRLVVLAAVPLSIWLVYPIAASAATYRAPSSTEAYYAPLVEYLDSVGGTPGRVEIPFTSGHWEAAYVAPHVRLARGWERQTDMARNGLFYDGSLDAQSYQRWLRREAVRWIAVPDTGIDQGGAAEVAFLQDADVPWLRPAWHDAHWTVFEVVGASPLVEAPGRVIAVDARGIDLVADRPGPILVHETYTPYWTLSGARGCIRQSPGGLTIIEASEPGPMLLQARFSIGALDPGSASC